MRRRILFVSYTANWTGPTNSLLHLLKYLRHDYNVAVLLPGQGLFSERLSQEKIPFFSLPKLDKWSILTINNLIRHEKFGLVYANSTHGSSRNALIAARMARVPFISHIREMGWDKSWLELGYLRFADAVIAVSRACGSSIIRYVSKHKLYVVYNGIEPLDPESVTDSHKRGCPVLDLPRETNVIVSVGHLCLRKGQEFAVRAMAEVIRSAPQTCLVLVGSLERDISYVDKVRSIVRKNNLNKHVFMVGFRNDVGQILQQADLFLHTALKDPHPRSVIEAMGIGLPVVAFAADGVSETVQDHQTGILVKPKDVQSLGEAIVNLLLNPKVRETFGQNGKARVEKFFSAEATANQVAEIIDRTLNKRAA